MLKSLLNKVAGPEACSFIKKRLQHRYFPVKFAKFLRTFCSFFLMAPVLESFHNKFKSSDLQLYEKKTPTQVFFCEICKISKNTFFEEYLRTTASAVSFSWHLCWSLFIINLQVFRSATLLKRDFRTGVFL